MKAFEDFSESVRQLLPGSRPLIESLSGQHPDDHIRLIKELTDRSLLTHSRLCQLWADALGVAYVNPFNVEVPRQPPQQLPAEIARGASAIALNSLEDTVTVAMAQPQDQRLVESLSKVLGCKVSPVFAHPDEIRVVLEMYFGDQEGVATALRRACDDWPTLEGGREIRSADDVVSLVHSKAVIELFNSILLTAFNRKASDIHLEPGADECRVRMRIDGDMTPIIALPREIHETLIVRLKVLSKLDVAQKRLPQDGAFEIDFAGKRPAFRASTMPGIYGEKGVLRILGSPLDQSVLRLNALGLAHSTREALRRVINRPNGILLVCGPTGSGKTTTLYGCLNEINRPDVSIVTIEDPVEYRLSGISQNQVNAQIGLTFGRILRGILRQDPDIILIGEIRDLETASIATEAALTGHFVFSTLHTNNSLQAVTRLVEIGVEPYLVAPTAMGVLSQRLVRRICSACKEPYHPSHDELAPYFKNIGSEPLTLYRGRGCPQCFGSGYLGRVGIYEFIEVSETMRELILRKAPPNMLVDEARRYGFRSLRQDGLKKALLGWTTLEEVERNTLPEMSYTV